MERRDERDTNQANGNSNRLQLNLGSSIIQNNNNQNYSAEAARQFPTTPSTFPQPVFANQYGQRETWGTQSPSAPNGYSNMNYFVNNPYANGNNNAPQANLTPGGVPQRGQPGYDNAANGLVSQFRDQNLSGNSQRPVSPYQPPGKRSAPSGQRPNTTFGGSIMHEENPPDKDTGGHRYAENIGHRGKASKGLINAFFKENVQRARDRNTRYVRTLHK